MKRRLTWRALAAILVATGLVPFASAQEPPSAYPSRNITLIVPQAAGGPPDIVARLVATPLAEILGKPIVVENRPGASASIGAAAVAKAAPDGYTLLFIEITVVVAPSLVAKVAYNPGTDFAPISTLARSWLTMVVSNKTPAANLKELLAVARARPNELKFASSGVGSPPHLGGLAFMQATGVTLSHVPYRGTAPAVTDIVGGHIEVIFVSLATAEAQAKAGQVRIFAVTGPQRFPALPSVATFKEQGIDLSRLDDGVWFGLAAPAGTPSAIIEKLNSGVNRALADPAVKARIEKANFKPEGGSPAVLGNLIKDHATYWSSLLRNSGIQPKEQ
jgi:tripartite-type tricarboxylate transporter receptor subunit TctC